MARANDRAMIGTMALFKGVDPADVARLTDMLRWRQVAAATCLIVEEQPAEAVYFIVEGTVRVYAALPDDNEVTLAILGPGDIVGELGVLDNLGRSASAVTLEPTGVYWMDRTTFLRCVRGMPGLAFNLALILARRLRLADARMRALSSLDVEGRVAHMLVELAREYGVPEPDGAVRIPLHLTQGELARLVGASRVRVNQIMGTLKQRHFIAMDRQSRITVRDVAALERHRQ